jgi:DNA-binding transcriptional LysR family regulator
LFLRNNKGVSLSQNGQILLPYAEQVINLLDKAKTEFFPASSNQPLKLGATQTLSASSLPKFLAIFNKQYPNISFSLKTASQQYLLDQVAAGELDGAFISGNYKKNAIKTVLSLKEKTAIISAASNHNITSLKSKPILVNHHSDCPYRTLLEKWAKINIGVVKRFEFDNLESIIHSVEEDMGISLLPKSVIPNNSRINIHDLPSTLNTITTHFVIRKNHTVSLSLRHFIDIVLSK